jgi:N-acetylglucosamine-6-phosphate deacetylase
MLFKNAVLFRPDCQFQRGSFSVEGNRLTAESHTGESVDLAGKYVIPGLIDLHTHGNSGTNFADGSDKGLYRMARFLLKNGITSFSPASTTLPEKQLQAAFESALRLKNKEPEDAASIRGITMEGPFFNAAKKGAQNADYLLDPDYDLFSRLNRVSDYMIRIVCVAPELPGALPFIRKAKNDCVVSVAHTTATYDQAKAGFDAGARHVTHLFNAMPPLAHREPGVIGAAADHPDVNVELISDGIHIHPSAIRAAFKLFGPDRIILISDAMSACGMPDGTYELDEQEVHVSDGKVTLADGTIAGSAAHLFDCMRRAISFGIRPEDAIRAATINPARVIGADQDIGSMEFGKRADFVVCNLDWSIDAVYRAGKHVRREP